MPIAQIARLSWADLKHDWLVSLCIVTSLVAVMAPMLLLFGLKYGVISTMQEQLLHDPRNLEIRMLSSGSYDQAWLDRLAAYPGAGFVIGLTRSLNTQADFIRSGAQFVEGAEVLPTAAGDPLLDKVDVAALRYTDIVLTAQAAGKLDVRRGDTVRLRIARRLDGLDERAVLQLTVLAVLAPDAYGRPAGFVVPELLRDMEWYRDGYAVPAMVADPKDGRSPADAKVRFAKARVYARNMDDVEALEKSLNDLRIETSSRLADIRNVKSINQLLTSIFVVIAATAMLGCMASLAGSFLANVRRKRREIATLRLLGLNGTAVAAYILLQALVLTAFAFVVGLAVYFVGSSIFDRLLGLSQATGQYVCRITVGHALIALALTAAVALLGSFLGVLDAWHIQPAESLRDI